MAGKKALPVVLAVVLLPLGVMVAVGGAKYLAYRDNRMKCESPIPRARLKELRVDLPPDATVCRESKTGATTELDVIVEAPSVVCFGTGGLAGCPSLAGAALKVIGPMADAGWGTGHESGPKTEDSDTVTFVRKGASARMMLFRSRHGEITGTFMIDTPGGAAGDDDEDE